MAEETVTDRKLWQSLEDIESTLLQQPFAEESYAQSHSISLDSWQSENEGINIQTGSSTMQVSATGAQGVIYRDIPSDGTCYSE